MNPSGADPTLQTDIYMKSFAVRMFTHVILCA